MTHRHPSRTLGSHLPVDLRSGRSVLRTITDGDPDPGCPAASLPAAVLPGGEAPTVPASDRALRHPRGDRAGAAQPRTGRIRRFGGRGPTAAQG